MTKHEADIMLTEQLAELKRRADNTKDNGEYVSLTEAFVKVYLMMYQASGFAGGTDGRADSGLLN